VAPAIGQQVEVNLPHTGAAHELEKGETRIKLPARAKCIVEINIGQG
jgi:hypothetical protein